MKLGGRDRINLAMKLKTVSRRQIPPELVFLAHDQRKLAPELIGPEPGNETEHARFAATRINEARQHLERRGLARAIWSQESHHLTGFDCKTDLFDGVNFAVFTVIQSAQGTPHSLLFLNSPI